MNRRLLAPGLVLAVCLAAALACTPSTSNQPSVVVIGIDGMDPQLLQRYVDAGRMPHFAALIEQGSFVPLETSVPPQSPVAWSNFITGMDSGGHGVFDFIHRDPQTYEPIFSAALVAEPERTFSIGDWVIPLEGGKTELLRKGEAFWQIFDAHDVPYEIVRVPANFPPADSDDRTISGMGTPDLLGSYGTFSFFTDDDRFTAGEVSGGTIYRVDIEDNRIEAALTGPPNTLLKQRPDLEHAFTVELDPEQDVARISMGDEVAVLRTGEWSDWMPVTFDLVGPLKRLSGICRFYLRSARPTFQLYVTPINLDPARPALPISTPESYAPSLSDRIGRFYTQGMPEETKALEAGVLNDGEFVAQTGVVMSERWRMLDAVLDGYRGGFLFFYVSTVDQSCHVLWRNTDERHPAHAASPGFEDRFEQLYAEMDSLLGVVVDRVPDDATVIVMSDHGFAPYYKKFHLNTWLYEQGYMVLERPELIGQYPLLGNVFWRRTRAYAMGINGLYVNRVGREGKGIVREGEEYETLLEEISAKLLALRDDENGEPIVTRVYRPRDVYHGDLVVDAPDLIVGYNRGYRGSDASALGTLTESVLTPNLSKWTGSHCMDHTLVPGVLLTNRSLAAENPALIDLPVTILGLYGIEKPAQMRGRAIFTR